MAAGKKRRSGLTLILIALILILGLVAVVLWLPKVLGLGAQTTPSSGTPQAQVTPTQIQEMEQIVVLQQPIKRGEEIKESMLLKVFYPKAQMKEGLFITDIKDALKKRAKYDLEAGIPLTQNLLVPAEGGSFYAFQIPAGYVAITIPITRLTSVAYALQPGDHVNIIGTISLVDLDQQFQTKLPNGSAYVTVPYEKVPTDGEKTTGAADWLQVPFSIQSTYTFPSEGRFYQNPGVKDHNGNPVWTYIVPSETTAHPRQVSSTLVQDAIVLWVGDFPINQPTTQTGTATGPTPTPTIAPTPVPGATAQEPERPSVITLIVTPQDSVTINYLLQAGAKLNLALRSAGDTDQAKMESVTLQFILEQYSIPVPAKLEYGIEPIVTP